MHPTTCYGTTPRSDNIDDGLTKRKEPKRLAPFVWKSSVRTAFQYDVPSCGFLCLRWFLTRTIAPNNITEAQDRVVSGLCSHIYHRKCILEWLNNKKRHDSCPNCRQPMWEPETYQAIKEDILQNKAHDLKAQTIMEDV
jgi:hypothetical protein